jgi:flagellar basal-body rod modification protein FlgD
MIENNVDIFKQLGLSVPETKKNDELGQTAFLKLMTTQLANQDPFKPLESGEFLGQIAQFSMVSGIDDLNESFATFAGSMASNQALQASTLVGRTVVTAAELGSLPEEQPFSGVVELLDNAADLNIEIIDSSGQVIKQLNMGSQAQGLVTFIWDGVKDDGSKASPGDYRIKAIAEISGEQLEVNTSGFGTLWGPPALSGVVDLTQDVSDLTVEITDTSGQILKILQLGRQEEGLVSFSWNGLTDNGRQVDPGKYRMNAIGTYVDKQIAYETLVETRVESVTLGRGGQGLTLNVSGNERISFDQVRQVK